MSLASQQNFRTLLVLIAALLSPLFGGPHHAARLVAGQGLAVSPDNLVAGVNAAANESEQFESALELATTGERGRYVRSALGVKVAGMPSPSCSKLSQRQQCWAAL
jgi:hypothetical protein